MWLIIPYSTHLHSARFSLTTIDPFIKMVITVIGKIICQKDQVYLNLNGCVEYGMISHINASCKY